MDEERVEENVNRKNEKRIKLKSKKEKKNKEGAMGIQEAHNIGTTEVIGSVRISDKEVIAEMKKDGQEKENKETKDAEADMEKGPRENELTDVYGENGSTFTMDNERKRTKRKKDKNKNDKKMSNTEEVKGNQSARWLQGESLSVKKSDKEVKKGRKKQKMKGNPQDGDIEGGKHGEAIGTHGENFRVNATEMTERGKRKKDKKKSKEENFTGSQDTYSETKHHEGDLSSLQPENVAENGEGDIQSTKHDGNAMKELERKKKKKHKGKKKHEDGSHAALQDSVDNDSNGLMHSDEIQNNEAEYASKEKKTKAKFMENGSDNGQDNEVECAKKGKKGKTKSVENGPDDTTPNKSNKKVRFSGQVEVFPLPGDSNTEKQNDEENLVRGKRFTREEDEIVKDAVLKYIEEHELGDEGLDMVLNCSKYPNLKGCWKEIASAIPYRPYLAIYCRARVLFLRSEKRKWTQAEYDAILRYQQEHGNQWRALADELGKHTWHVKDTWRRIKLPNLKKGHWSQEEYQKLFDLVNTDLQLKVSEEKKSKHGMLRDNICWTAVSDELSTRSQATCCLKWYKQLTSPMVAEGVWADSDDYRLLTALYSLDANCMEDVDWDDLVDNRSGDLCRKRWNQMVLHIGHHGNKSFAEQVEVLAHRYCPHLLEAREAWDSKPRVP